MNILPYVYIWTRISPLGFGGNQEDFKLRVTTVMAAVWAVSALVVSITVFWRM